MEIVLTKEQLMDLVTITKTFCETHPSSNLVLTVNGATIIAKNTGTTITLPD